MGQLGLKTGTPSSDQGLVGRWGRPVLRPGRSEDGAQHIYNVTGKKKETIFKAKKDVTYFLKIK